MTAYQSLVLGYLPALQTIVQTYNQTPHRGLRGKTPLEVHMLKDPEDWRKQFKAMYKSSSKVNKRISSKLDIGSFVRIVSSSRSERFATGYSIQNTEEIFRIKKIKRSKFGVVTFELEDWGKEPIKGIFYREELIPVTEPDTFGINILKRRKKRDGTYQYLVNWLSYPRKFDQWVDGSQISQISDLPPS